MTTTNRIAATAALIGEPARAAMLAALMDGRALTAAELAYLAGVAPQTASGHLARLTEAGLIGVARQGRHRYHRLASPEVARLLEAVMQVAAAIPPVERRRRVVGPADAAMRAARTCYDHLAGRLGVAIADAMVDRGLIELGEDSGALTAAGTRFLGGIGIDLVSVPVGIRPPTRVFCRPCLDWSERRVHVAGRVGAAICSHVLQAGWVRHMTGTRALAVTPPGRRALAQTFGVELAP